MKLTLKEYIRGLLIYPSQTARAILHYGTKGFYLGTAVYLFRGVPFAFRFNRFGVIGTYNEFLSIYDNFIEGELRESSLESAIRGEAKPVIIDLGINLGISVRWWFALNKNARVTGIDMIPEALDFTTERLKTIPGTFDWHGIPAAVSDKPDELHIQYDNPLEGSNSVFSESGSIKRTVKADTLDALLQPFPAEAITVLKIDIEGFGGIALRGAAETLKKTKYIILETHSPEEISEANKILSSTGWELYMVKGRSAFYRNPSALAK